MAHCGRNGGRSIAPWGRVGRAGPKLLVAAALATGGLALAAGQAGAATDWYVSPSGSGRVCSAVSPCALYNALIFAASGDTILLAAGTYVGNFTIATSLTLEPASSGTTPVLSGGANGTVVTVTSGTTVIIEGATVTDGQAPSGSNGSAGADGGGISNSGTLTLTDSLVVGNRAGDGGGLPNAAYGTTGTGGDGGGIWNGAGAMLTVVGSTIENNQAGNGGYALSGYASAGPGGNGGGIANDGGTVTLTESSVLDNQSGAGSTAGGIGNSGNGGGLYNADSGELSLDDSTVGDNTAATSPSGCFNSAGTGGSGGGIYSVASLSLTDSTVSGNASGGPSGSCGGSAPAGNGGGIDNAGSGVATVVSSTVSGNGTQGNGSAVDNESSAATGLETAATIFQSTSASNACAGTLTDDGYNLGSDSSCVWTQGSSSDSAALQTGLSALGSYGGPTETVGLDATSPTLNLIPDPTTATVGGNSVALCPGTDQRDVVRPQSGSCDVGAFEAVQTVAGVTASSPSIPGGASETLTATVSFQSPNAPGFAPRGTVEFSVAGGGVLGTATLDGGSPDTATLTTTALPPGSDTVDAQYVGPDLSSPPTFTPVTVVSATTTDLTSSANPVAVGAAVTYTATVSPTDNGGTVTFYDNGSTITGCSAQPLTAGQATCALAAGYASAGSHDVVAVYSGDTAYAGSTSTTLNEGVGVTPTTTSVTSSANPAAVGAAVTYTATVSSSDGGGTVAFYDNGSTIAGCGAQTLTAGQATCSLGAGYPGTGTHPITTVYSGDAASGRSSSPTLDESVITTPGAPTDLSAVPGDGEVTLSWGRPVFDGASAITGYLVYENGNLLNAGPITDTTDTVGSLTDGTNYSFVVAAVNAVGPGTPATTSATPVAVPGAPTVTASSASDHSVSVTWSAPTSTGGSAITGFLVAATPPDAPPTIVPVSPATTSQTIAGLANGTTYAVTVTAENAVGSGPASAAVALTPTGPPDAPRAVVATAGNGSASLTWIAPGDEGSPITGYTVTSSPSCPSCTGAAATGTSATVSGLTNGVAYTFTVTATNAQGTSPASRASDSVTPQAPSTAYWETNAAGSVSALGGAPFLGDVSDIVLAKPIVGMAATPDHGGYYLVASDGGIFTFGDATFQGSMGGTPLNAPIVGMAVDPATGGYWEVASDGGVFSFGAPFLGSMGGKPLNQPIVAMVATADGGGYWLVAKDGGIFAFGDAGFHGSMGGKALNAPIVAMAATPDGGGYWEVGADGGIFTFGDAGFAGSLGGQTLAAPVTGMIAGGPDSYWIVAANGTLSPFGAPPAAEPPAGTTAVAAALDRVAP